MDKEVEDRMRLMYGDVPPSPTGLVLNGQGNKSLYHEPPPGKKYLGNAPNIPTMNRRELNSMIPPANYNVLHQQHPPNNYSPPQVQGLPPPGLYNLNGNLPPPGLPSTPHLNQCNAPPGFYYPPPPPPRQQQQQSHQLYNLPRYGNHNSSALYSLQRPILQTQQPSSLPSSSPVQQPQNQFHFSNLSFMPAELNLQGRSICEEGGLGFQQNSVRDTDSMNGDVASSGSQVGTGGKNVIEPMIENIVGSMSMSTNGTYTHFGGPSHPISTKYGGGGNTTVTMSNTYPSPFTVVSDSVNSLQIKEVKTVTPHQLHLITKGAVDHSKILQDSKVEIVQPKVIGKEHVVMVEKIPQRAVTPKDGVDSRPQTPGKLSYSEVLTKNEPKGSGTTIQKTNSAPSSNSPSPAPATSRSLDSSLPSTGSTPVKNSHRRTSVSNCHPTDFYSEVVPSNSSSSSSSPTTKPKLTSAGSFDNNKFRGKENSSNSSSKSSTARNTPAGTPVHSCAGGRGVKLERKVLSSNVGNNNSQTTGTGKSKVIGAGSSNTKNAKSFQFEFDIEDLDDIQEKLLLGGKGGKRGSSSGYSASSTGVQPSKNSASNSSSTTPNVSLNGNLTNNVEKKTGPSLSNGVKIGNRNGRDKNERNRGRKGGQSIMVRRVQILTAVWFRHLISAVNWLWSLVLNVGTLSCSLAFTLLEDGYSWWKTNAVPSARALYYEWRSKLRNIWKKFKSKIPWRQEEKSDTDPRYSKGTKDGEILSMMGPERNILLPASGEEALKRLLSVKGQDPYSILGVRSDSTDETIRRYYKKQAVLVHPDKNLVPGAEEAFKILARAFELVGEPAKRFEYHRQLLEAHQKERVFGEIGNLLEQLRKKMESVTNTIRCTKCNSRHNKVRTDRPLFAARYCAQCRINHAAREGDLWAEKKGLFGFSRQYYACMDSSIWEVNEWASCQKKNLKHLQPDSHNVMYRLVAGGGNNPSSSSSKYSNKGQTDPNSFRNNCDNSSFNYSSPGDDANGSFEDPLEPEMDDWDTLINNLFRSSNIAGGGSGSSQHNKNSSNSGSSSTRVSSSGSFNSSSKFTGMGTNSNPTTAASAAGGGLGSANGLGGSANAANVRRRGKVKRK